jgi:hypothetical protein
MWDDLGEHGLRGQYAGFVSRMLAFGIDIVVIVVMLIALGWLVDTVTTLFRKHIPDSYRGRGGCRHVSDLLLILLDADGPDTWQDVTGY